jgi:predicted RNA-binding protein
MCEFTVYLIKEGNNREMIAKNVVAVKKRNGKIMLMEAFGPVTTVEGATIEEANTFTQEMILKKEMPVRMSAAQ